MGLAFHSIERVGPTTLLTTLEQRRRSFDVERYRQRHADLARRREEELRLLERQLGRLPVSETLPNTEPEVAAFRPELVRRLAALPTRTFHSLESLVQRHRDPSDGFSFAEFDFINFDDRRAAAALRVLAELSHSTQVTVFTHHRHLLELARATLEADLFCVHELQPLAPVRLAAA